VRILRWDDDRDLYSPTYGPPPRAARGSPMNQLRTAWWRRRTTEGRQLVMDRWRMRQAHLLRRAQ